MLVGFLFLLTNCSFLSDTARLRANGADPYAEAIGKATMSGNYSMQD